MFFFHEISFYYKVWTLILYVCKVPYHLNHYLANLNPFEIIFDHLLPHIGRYLNHIMTNVGFQELKRQKLIRLNTVFHVSLHKYGTISVANGHREYERLCDRDISIAATWGTILWKLYFVQIVFLNCRLKKVEIIIKEVRSNQTLGPMCVSDSK